MGRLRVLPALWLVLLLTAPLAAWLLGVRQPLLQNRPKEPFPAFNRSSLRDPATFTRIDSAVLDRLPLRGTALALRARVEIDVFRDSPNPQIAIGDGGWLYFVPELGPCTPGTEPSSDPADAWDVLARTLVAAGYRPVVISAGSKLLIHTSDAPDLDEAATRCVDALERRVAERLTQTPGGLTIDARLRALEARGKATFLRYDSHWNWRGRQTFVRGVLEGIRPGLAKEADPRPGNTYEHAGDLATLQGVTRTEQDRALEANAPRRPLPPGEVLLIGDSQLENALLTTQDPATLPIRDRVLPGQPSCDWTQLGGGACDEQLRAARTVVIEKVARDALLVTSTCWDPLEIAAARLIDWREARWEAVDGDEVRPLPNALTMPASGRLAVRLRPAGPDIATVPRLLRLTVFRTVTLDDGSPAPVTAAQQPRSGGPAPCATPSQATAGQPLLLPVPAGRPASDLVVELLAPPGTRLGDPREIVLDGSAHTRR